MQAKFPQVRIAEEVKKRLMERGKMGDSFTDVISELLDRAEYCEEHHVIPVDWREREGKALARGPALVGAY